CRNGARIDKIVLHCTEASLAGTIEEFQKSGGRQVSAHYVIDRNGDIYQMVSDSDRANHCMGANESSNGSEHVGTETDSRAMPELGHGISRRSKVGRRRRMSSALEERFRW